jgi:hypothetical protein
MNKPLAAEDRRPTVNSFDVFNTLIARRCADPRALRARIAEEFGLPDFPELRHQAEIRVEHREYGLDDIYAEMVDGLGVRPDIADALKRAETEAELANVIPIAEHLAQVQAGDLLVSDMYLGAEMVRRLLDRAGLTAEASLVVTANGKRSGSVWPQLLQRFDIARHLGDDPKTDIASPQAFGIQAMQTSAAAFSDYEKYLEQQGLGQLALWVREARLTSRHADPALRQIQLRQISMNFPLLILAAIRVLRLTAALEVDRALFSARDCNLWLHAYDLLSQRFRRGAKATYFHTNRLLRTQPSPSYLAYSRSLIGDRSLIIDICGTGWSSSVLLDKLGVEGGKLFFIHDFSRHAIRRDYEAMAKPAKPRPIFAVIADEKSSLFNGSYLEMCNFADHAPVRDMAAVADGFVPVFSPDLRPHSMREAVRTQRDAFFHALKLAGHFDLAELLDIDDAKLDVTIATLYVALSQQPPLPADCFDFHREEDRRIMAELAS